MGKNVRLVDILEEPTDTSLHKGSLGEMCYSTEGHWVRDFEPNFLKQAANWIYI